MKSKKIALINGDGIGKEVIPQAKHILEVIDEMTDHSFEYIEIPAGGDVWKKTGVSISDASFKKLRSTDSILLGALGVSGLPQGAVESAVLKIRQEFDQYVNLRPVKLYHSLREICPLKEENIGDGINIAIIRENSEGIYRKIGGSIQNNVSIDSMVFTQNGVSRILEFAFEYAKKSGHKKICSVDKANLLHTSKFWRSMFEEMGKSYPDIQKENYYIDAFCQWLIRSPSEFQTVVTSNMFGDIISDEAAFLVGSLGMVASANLNPKPGKVSMFEPIHGSAPDIAGKNIANPIAAILSVKLMCELVFNDKFVGESIDTAISSVIVNSRTIDIFPRYTNKTKIQKVSTQEMGRLIQQELRSQLKK